VVKFHREPSGIRIPDRLRDSVCGGVDCSRRGGGPRDGGAGARDAHLRSGCLRRGGIRIDLLHAHGAEVVADQRADSRSRRAVGGHDVVHRADLERRVRADPHLRAA